MLRCSLVYSCTCLQMPHSAYGLAGSASVWVDKPLGEPIVPVKTQGSIGTPIIYGV